MWIICGWYGCAVLVTVIVWKKTKNCKPLLRQLFRSGVIAVGFSTFPISYDSEFLFIPIVLFYLTNTNLMESGIVFLTIIGCVWLLLFLISIIFALGRLLFKNIFGREKK